MKKVLMVHFLGCPFCRAAEGYLQELTQRYPELAAIPIERIDERIHPDIANQYDYWFVPTFYVDGAKAHEGACTRDAVEKVLRSAL